MRDNSHTIEAGDTVADTHVIHDQTSVERPILFWDKNQATDGQLFAGSTTELWINSVDYSGVAEGLPFCNTCDNVLTEWNYFDQICSDKDECKMQQTLYDAYVNDWVAIAAALSTAPVASDTDYLADHNLHCSTNYYPDTNIRRNNIMPTGSSIARDEPTTGGVPDIANDNGAFHMDCLNRGPYNSDHGFKCECPPGSELNTAGTHCVDIQECRLGQHECGWLPCIDFCAWGSSDGTIPNARWSTDSRDVAYTVCGYDMEMSMTRFDIMAYGVTGVGKDQVLNVFDGTSGTHLGSGGFTHYTDNTAVGSMTNYRPGGGYTCQCPEGLRWNATTRTCDDINECVGEF